MQLTFFLLCRKRSGRISSIHFLQILWKSTLLEKKENPSLGLRLAFICLHSCHTYINLLCPISSEYSLVQLSSSSYFFSFLQLLTLPFSIRYIHDSRNIWTKIKISFCDTLTILSLPLCSGSKGESSYTVSIWSPSMMPPPILFYLLPPSGNC